MLDKQKLVNIFESCDSLKILCGAGISCNSGIPLANRYLKFLFDNSGFTEKESQMIINRALPFEVWLKLYIDYTKYQNCHYHLLNIFRDDEVLPNRNHFLIADLIRKKIVRDVYTTNFDLLLESAFNTYKLQRDIDYKVFQKEDDFPHMRECVLPRLIKLHGSAEDYDSIRITIDSISKRDNVNYRKTAVSDMVCDNGKEKLLVLGYSWSDIFDIIPAIENTVGSHCDIIWIDHSTEEEDLTPLPNKWPGNKMCGYSGVKVTINTDTLVDQLYQIYNLEPPLIKNNVESDNYLLTKHVLPMFRTYVYSSNRTLIIAEIQRLLGEYKFSNQMIQQISDITELQMLKSQQHLYAKNLSNLNKWNEALVNYELEIKTRLSEIAVYCSDLKSIQMLVSLSSRDFELFIDQFSCFLSENKKYLFEDYIGIEGTIWDNSVGIMGALLVCIACLSELSDENNAETLITKLVEIIRQYPSIDMNHELSILILNEQGILYNKLKKYEKSIPILEETCERAHIAGNLNALAAAFKNLLNAYYLANKNIELTQEEQRYFKNICNVNSTHVIYDIFNSLLFISINLGNIDLLDICLEMLSAYKNKNQKLTCCFENHLSTLLSVWSLNATKYNNSLKRFLSIVREYLSIDFRLELEALGIVLDEDICLSVDHDAIAYIQKSFISSARNYVSDDIDDINMELFQTWSNAPDKHFSDIIKKIDLTLEKLKILPNDSKSVEGIRNLFLTLYSYKACALFEINKYPDATDVYRIMINLWSDCPEAWYGIGKCYELQENYTEALQCYDNALVYQKDDERINDINKAKSFVVSKLL